MPLISRVNRGGLWGGGGGGGLLVGEREAEAVVEEADNPGRLEALGLEAVEVGIRVEPSLHGGQ